MNDYSDIIELNHPTSLKHPRMSMENRAAQFHPFSALTGYDEAVKETARITENKKIVDENIKNLLDYKMPYIISQKCHVKISYFKSDERKNGGKYYTLSGFVKKIDAYKRLLIINDHKIKFDDIIDIYVDGNDY